MGFKENKLHRQLRIVKGRWQIQSQQNALSCFEASEKVWILLSGKEKLILKIFNFKPRNHVNCLIQHFSILKIRWKSVHSKHLWFKTDPSRQESLANGRIFFSFFLQRNQGFTRNLFFCFFAAEPGIYQPSHDTCSWCHLSKRPHIALCLMHPFQSSS